MKKICQFCFIAIIGIIIASCSSTSENLDTKDYENREEDSFAQVETQAENLDIEVQEERDDDIEGGMSQPIKKINQNTLEFSDINGNEVKVEFLLTRESIEKLAVYEGVITDENFSLKYDIVTNEFLRFDHPKSDAYKYIMTIKPSAEFHYLHLYYQEDNSFERIPFMMRDDGVIEARIDASSDYTIFALSKEKTAK